MLRVAVLVAVCCSVAGCGDNVEIDTIGIRPGSILAPRGFIVGGASLFRAWYDTREGVECRFALAADGRYRCVPDGDSVAFLDPDNYSDPGCTKRALVEPPCKGSRFARASAVPTEACADPEGIPVFEIGATRSSTRYFRFNQGACLPIEANAGEVVRDVGGEVAPRRFVSAQLTVLPGADPLAPYAFLADDGAVEMTSVWDTARGGECAAYGDMAVPRCVPREIALHYDMYWSDSTCTQHAAADLSRVRPCATPTAVLTAGGSYLEIGALVSKAYSNDSGACEPVSTDDPLDPIRFYAEGAAIPDEQFPEMTRELDGTERVRVLRFAAAGDREVVVGVTLYDTSLDEECTPVPATDGTVRCVVTRTSASVPAPEDHVGLFADAACKVPIATTYSADPPTAVVIFPPNATSSCPGSRSGLRQVGALYTGPLFWGTGCTPYAREPGASYWTLGPAGEFPRVRVF